MSQQRFRVKMGRQRLNANGLKMFDPARENLPWLFEQPRPVSGAYCVEDPDWDWWLRQSPEFRGAAVRAIRAHRAVIRQDR